MTNNLYFYLSIYIPVIAIIFSVLSIINKYLQNITDIKMMKSFQDYETLMDYYFDKAYTTIYKDNILVFSVEGMSPNEEDVENIQHQYLDLLTKMMGSWLLNRIENYYGDRKTFYYNALTYFDVHYENDAIKKDAIENQISE